MERPLSNFEIEAIVEAAKKRSKFVGSGTMEGTYKFLYENNIVKTSLVRNNNHFFDFYLTDYGYEYAKSILDLERL